MAEVKPDEVTFGEYIGNPVQLRVPRYQRAYEWRENRWLDLWRDIDSLYRRSGTPENERTGLSGAAHFMGTVIVQAGPYLGGRQGNELWVVDGQQRLVSLFLLEAARRDHAAALAGENPDPVPLALLFPGPDAPHRLIIGEADISSFDAAVGGEFRDGIPDVHAGTPVADAYRFFRYQLWMGRAADDIDAMRKPPALRRYRGVTPNPPFASWGEPHVKDAYDLGLLEYLVHQGLTFLEIKLNKGDEDPSIVFDTINGKTTQLQQFDHLRNSVFIRMPHRADSFYESMWRPAEDSIRTAVYANLRAQRGDQFLYEYLISLREGAVSMRSLHRAFMERAIHQIGYDVNLKTETEFEELFALPLVQAAKLYPMAVGATASTELAGMRLSLNVETHGLIRDTLTLSAGPTVPLHLRYLIALAAGRINEDDLRARLIRIQSFLVRQMLCDHRQSLLRSEFQEITTGLTDDSIEALEEQLAKKDWATDKDVLATGQRTPLTDHYKTSQVFVVLRGIEREMAGQSAHPVPYGSGDGEFTVEHLYPQSDNPGNPWRSDLKKWGGKAATIENMLAARHTLGNLTAVTHYDNRKNGRKPFNEKKTLIAATTGLKLHDSFLRIQKWSSQEIYERGNKLVRVALTRWPGPV